PATPAAGARRVPLGRALQNARRELRAAWMDRAAAPGTCFPAKLSGAARSGRAATRGPRRDRGRRLVDSHLRGDRRGVLARIFRRSALRRPDARRCPAAGQELPALLRAAQTETTRRRGQIG